MRDGDAEETPAVNEDGSGSLASGVARVLLDKDGNVLTDARGRVRTLPTARYRCKFKLKMREECSVASPPAGELDRGTLVRVLERRREGGEGGVERSQLLLEGTATAAGWVTSVSKSGGTHLETATV